MPESVKNSPVWEEPQDAPETSLPANSSCDVCVVGAGIAGLSVAYRLARAGKRVLVLDDGKVGGGMTSCTTAHLANVIDDRFSEIERIHGADGSKAARESHGAAVDFIEETVRREGIDCGFTRLAGYLFLAPGQNIKELDREEQAARRAGLEVERLARVPWTEYDTGPCLRFPNQGQFEPMRYLRGLVGAITRGGGHVIGNVHVKQVDGEGKRVLTAGGQMVRADSIVVATNSPVNDRLVIHTKQAPYMTYVVALRVPRGAVPPGLYWDMQDPYHYVRLADEQTLIVGGEDHKTGQARDHDERFGRLDAWARERFPQAGPVTNRWSGQVIETIDGLAFIGRNPDDAPNVYIATGDSGMGMTHGTIAGLVIGDLILGRENPWAALYNPARKRLGALRDFVTENVNVAAQYASWVTPGEVDSPAEIKPGTGAIVRDGLFKLAVYRDEEGELHACSAVCPHLSAIVTWNAAEKTWDCPAHGSRFDCKGKVINGPANASLRHVEPPVAH
jgi:glycine/D-amino acid oxidase-like deaminating enzyme/nitrite reductase/ring-hydroxylating ferredoxin subunit